MSEPRSYEIKTEKGIYSVDGFAVSESIAYRRDKMRAEWVIDHIPTGFRILGVKSEEAARIVSESLDKAIDWSGVSGEEKCELPPEVLAYINKARGQHRVAPMGEPWPEPPKKSFIIDIEGSHTLTIEQLWPDGDWPEDPTEEDVRELIEREGGAACIIAEWDLDVEATVTDCDAIKERLQQLKNRSK